MTHTLKQHLIIGLAGRHGVGKSTVANQLQVILEAQEYCVEVITLSAFYKEELAKATGGNLETIEQLKNTNTLTRWLLEKMGTEYFDSKILYKRMSDQISAIKQPSIILLDGVRKLSDEMFIHEALKGVVIMIYRDELESFNPLVVKKSEELLPSEVELSKLHIDYSFPNDSCSLVRLRSELRHLIFNEIIPNRT